MPKRVPKCLGFCMTRSVLSSTTVGSSTLHPFSFTLQQLCLRRSRALCDRHSSVIFLSGSLYSQTWTRTGMQLYRHLRVIRIRSPLWPFRMTARSSHRDPRITL
ncbi:hypothetical protein FOPG_18641 [Fusarium oxysporum f. sp. conglutinans race 2 54008]|uniref:Uncharacterized protein n=1 Tax=Fusarium oxysporum f. sp. conglutinans race 2 54008 TaxID=1089457 RepID=X0GN98_FUSOX|nr:hypothetical protein FOPG_18641 [Fusarium oxysporum f. sp. conglutinans race 2 54008]